MAFDVSDEQISKTEEIIGRKLPPIYRSLISRNNGGTAFDDEEEWQLFPIKDDTDRKRLSRSANHVIAETKSAGEWRNFPQDALAVGGGSSGDILLLLPSETDPSVFDDNLFVYRHETAEVEPLGGDLRSFEIE